MKYRNLFLTFAFCLSVIPLLVSCGTGVDSPNSSGENNGNTAPAFTFTPNNDVPGAGSIVMEKNTALSTSDVLAIDIKAHQVGLVFGAAFDVEFDPAVIQFDGEVPGPLFNCDKSSVCRVKLITGNPAKLVIAASLVGSNTTQGDGTIVTLKFKAIGNGNSALNFKGNSLLDSDLKPVKTNWSGGSLKKI